MKELEKYITDNREKFNREEPEKGHFERFESRQADYRKRSDSFSWKYMLQAAVIALLIVISTLWVYEKISGIDEDTTLITLADISPEYREAEIYYTALINRKYNEIKSFDFHSNSREREILLQELSEMDTIYKSLAKELNAERGNQMVISAMIKHYQLKLEIMSRILEHLYQVQSDEQIKSENDENIRI